MLMFVFVFSLINTLKWNVSVLLTICECLCFSQPCSYRRSKHGSSQSFMVLTLPSSIWDQLGHQKTGFDYNDVCNTLCVARCSTSVAFRMHPVLHHLQPKISRFAALVFITKIFTASLLDEAPCCLQVSRALSHSRRHSSASSLFCILTHSASSQQGTQSNICFASCSSLSECAVLRVWSRRTDRCPLTTVEHNRKRFQGQHSKKAGEHFKLLSVAKVN